MELLQAILMWMFIVSAIIVVEVIVFTYLFGWAGGVNPHDTFREMWKDRISWKYKAVFVIVGYACLMCFIQRLMKE